MPQPAETLSQNFLSHLADIEKTRKKSEELFAKGHIVRRDINIIYSGLYMDAITSFERFIENLFHSLLSHKVVHQSKRVKPKIKFESEELSITILKGERSYIDWFPYDITMKRAKACFKDGLPFCGLDKGRNPALPSIDKRVLKSVEKFVIIRNVLAHKSTHSFKRFEDKIIAETALSTREKKPIGYLRGYLITTPTPVTRYEQLISEMKYIAQLITSRTLH